MTAKTSSGIGALALVFLAIQFGLQPILYKEYASQVTTRSVLVIGCEICKLLLSLGSLVSSGTFLELVKTWNFYDSLKASGVPACTYAIQNILLQIAYQHVPSIVFNLVNQTKLLSAALGLYLFMDTRFSREQYWAMVLLLSAALLLALAKERSTDKDTDMSVERGLVPLLVASLLSGLGSALTQRSMQTYQRDAALVTIELSIYGSLFLTVPVLWSTFVVQTPNAVDTIEVVFQGCDYYTLIPVVSNALGGLLVGAVTKYVGGVLKSFALVCGIAFTAFVESYVYGVVLPIEVFLATGLVAISMAIYSSYPYVKKRTKAKTE